MGHMGKNLCDLQAGWDIFSRTLAMITFPAEKGHDRSYLLAAGGPVPSF